MDIHIVNNNDTIFSIAALYGTSPSRIISDNGLYNLPYLVPGQALIILVPETVHTVTQGETLFSIASLYGVSVLQIAQRNPTLIENPILYPGQQIAITFRGQENYPIDISGYAYTYISDLLLRETLAYLSDMAVFGYGFTEEGNLIPINDQWMIEESRRFGARPIFLLTSITEDGNFSTQRASRLFNDANLQQTVINNMLSVMLNKGYQGVDIDFEFINLEDREPFISFVSTVSELMHRYGFTVNVDLAPKTSREQKGLLYEAHDYAALGAAADTVLLMTYEWGYTYGPPLAVAPLPSVERVVSYAVSEIAPEKIRMGIPNYGYDWALPYEKGVTRANSIGNEEAIMIAAQNGATISFDETDQAPFFEYYEQNNTKHIVWFEDIRSIRSKYDLIKKYNLKGAGYWNLMRPFSQNWAYLAQGYQIAKQ